MTPQWSARRENCLSAKREFFPGSEARMIMVEKRSVLLPKPTPYFLLHRSDLSITLRAVSSRTWTSTIISLNRSSFVSPW